MNYGTYVKPSNQPYPTGCTQHCNDGRDCTETTQHCRQHGRVTNHAHVEDVMSKLAVVIMWAVLALGCSGVALLVWWLP